MKGVGVDACLKKEVNFRDESRRDFKICLPTLYTWFSRL